MGGSSDALHCLDLGGEYADRREKQEGGCVRRFHAALQDFRSLFQYGNGRVVARAVAKRFRFPWRAPLAPHSQSTRMVIYESRRCPPNFFLNLRCVVYSLRFREREAVENIRRAKQREGVVPGPRLGWGDQSARKYRLIGRNILDPSLLLFITGRYEFRHACTLSYVPHAQSLLVS